MSAACRLEHANDHPAWPCAVAPGLAWQGALLTRIGSTSKNQRRHPELFRSSASQVQFLTTGGGRVRCNPNLYDVSRSHCRGCPCREGCALCGLVLAHRSHPSGSGATAPSPFFRCRAAASVCLRWVLPSLPSLHACVNSTPSRQLKLCIPMPSAERQGLPVAAGHVGGARLAAWPEHPAAGRLWEGTVGGQLWGHAFASGPW